MRTIAIALLPAVVVLAGAVPEFEPNVGQTKAEFRYLARTADGKALISDSAIVFPLPGQRSIAFRWSGANGAASTHWTAGQPSGNAVRYCNSGSQTLCQTDVPGFQKLRRRSLYDHIDLVFHGRNGRLEYDLHVEPGADTARMRLRVEGEDAHVDRDGTLKAGAVHQWRPVAWQNIDGTRVPVEVSWKALAANEFGFALGPWRRDHELIIDPVIESASAIGGSGEDRVIGVSGSYRWGVTRSADWSEFPQIRGADVFVQFTNHNGTSTVFWGGDGDEQIAGSDSTSGLTLVGWTNSQNATLSRDARAYAGGATDGFVIGIAGSTLTFASYYGGPGADRLYDVRRAGVALAVTGETDDPAWPDAKVRLVGVGGKTDAIAGILEGPSADLLVIGGSGDDRAMRLRPAGSERWIIAGETDSPDFPLSIAPASGIDTWIGRLTFSPLTFTAPRLFGGSGNDRLAGIGWFPGQGVYIGGTTNSSDLPALKLPFNGGSTDGFIAHLNEDSLEPVSTSCLGGSGTDEVTAFEAVGGDLYAAGATDSPELALPFDETKPNGALDGLLVVADATATPMRAIRIGGPGNDRINGFQPAAAGTIVLAGETDSADWLREADRSVRVPGGVDGFALTTRFASTDASFESRFRPSPTNPALNHIIGRDLQKPLYVRVVSEEGMDGILRVRSSDPSRLLVSPSRDTAGSESLLLRDAERDPPVEVWLQALSDSGEVDVIFEGRTGSPAGSYGQRRVRIRLAPSALFVETNNVVSAVPDQTLSLMLFTAAVAPNGAPELRQSERPGANLGVSALSSDPSSLVIGQVSQIGDGGYSVGIRLVGEGSYTVQPVGTRIHAAPGAQYLVRSRSATAVFGEGSFVLAKDHITEITLSGSPGDSLRFASSDPSRLLLGTERDPQEATLTTSAPSSTVYVKALENSGFADVHVEGIYRGQPVSETVRVRFVPYTIHMTGVPAEIGQGGQVFVRLELRPSASTGRPMFASPALVRALVPVSSDSDVLRFVSTAGDVHTFEARQPGVGRIELRPDRPEFNGIGATVRVVPRRLAIQGELLIAAGTATQFYAGPNVFSSELGPIRARLGEGATLTLSTLDSRGTSITFNAQIPFNIDAELAQPGQRAMLFLSAAGIPEYGVPIRVLEPVLKPTPPEIRVPLPENGPATTSISWTIHGYDDGRVIALSGDFRRMMRDLDLQPVVAPAGICSAASVRVPKGSSAFSTSTSCTALGEVVVGLPVLPGFSRQQPELTARISVVPPVAVRPNVPQRLLTGAGLQTPLRLGGDLGAMITITSTQPDRVRLSLDAKAPGVERIQVGPFTAVYVQGFASDGMTVLTVESSAGWTVNIPVYLFPSTIAVRQTDGTPFIDSSARAFVDHPRSTPELPLAIQPFLVDTATGKLLGAPELTIRGGTDPMQLALTVAPSGAGQLTPTSVIVNEGDVVGKFVFRPSTLGEAVVSVEQPQGFTSTPASSLTVRVFEQELRPAQPIVLGANLQVPIGIGSLTSGGLVDATITSLDPDKVLVSASATVPGSESVTVRVGSTVYVQGLDGVPAGTRARLSFSAPGWATSEGIVDFAQASLQVAAHPSANNILELRPPQPSFLQLVYGLTDSFGIPMATAQLRPGLDLPVRVTSSDPSVVSVAEPESRLSASMGIRLNPLRPGNAELAIEAPPGILNRAERVGVRVLSYAFSYPTLYSVSQGLVSSVTIRNPRREITPITMTSLAGAIRLGTSASGNGAPFASTITLTLGPEEQRAIFLEAAGPVGTRGAVEMTAPETERLEFSFNIYAPDINFGVQTPASTTLAAGTLSIPIVLSAGIGAPEAVLGNSKGPVQIQLQSSDERVVRVPANPIVITPGQSRATAVLQLVGRGEAAVSFNSPAGFNGDVARRTLLVVVR